MALARSLEERVLVANFVRSTHYCLAQQVEGRAIPATAGLESRVNPRFESGRLQGVDPYNSASDNELCGGLHWI